MTETLRRGYPGMKSVMDMPVVQDGPPPGGFPSIRYARRIPNTGPSGATLFSVAALVMTYGFYKLINSNQKRRAVHREMMQSRYALVPVLQAEEDRRFLAAQRHFQAVEAIIMKDVPGWEVGKSVYLTKRWHPPAQPVGAWASYNDYPSAW